MKENIHSNYETALKKISETQSSLKEMASEIEKLGDDYSEFQRRFMQGDIILDINKQISSLRNIENELQKNIAPRADKFDLIPLSKEVDELQGVMSSSTFKLIKLLKNADISIDMTPVIQAVAPGKKSAEEVEKVYSERQKQLKEAISS